MSNLSRDIAIQKFIAAECVADRDASVSTNCVYAAFQTQFPAEAESVTKTMLTRRVGAELGTGLQQSNGFTYIVGVRLRNPVTDPIVTAVRKWAADNLVQASGYRVTTKAAWVAFATDDRYNDIAAGMVQAGFTSTLRAVLEIDFGRYGGNTTLEGFRLRRVGG